MMATLEAINYLKSNYEKRRDWGEADRRQPARDPRIPNANERGQRFVEIAKMASEKLKKRPSRSSFGSAYLRPILTTNEAPVSCSRSSMSEKMWDKLADVSERQGRAVQRQR